MQHFDETVDEELLTHEAVEEYIDDCKIRNLSPTTVHWYKERLKKILVDAIFSFIRKSPRKCGGFGVMTLNSV